MAKLTIGYSPSSGSSANPSSLPIKLNETIDVTATDDCHVCFFKNDIFDDKQHRKGSPSPPPWKPKKEGDATYCICAHDEDCEDCKKKPIENTYSIHVGS